MRLSRSDILKAEDLPTEEVAVPEWGGSVLVRGLTGRERDLFEVSMAKREGKQMVPDVNNVRAKLVAWCCVDDDGEFVFDQAGDVEALGEKSGAALNRVYEVAARLSGLSDEDVEEMVKDLKENPFGGSASSSPSISASPSPASSPSPPAAS